MIDGAIVKAAPTEGATVQLQFRCEWFLSVLSTQSSALSTQYSVLSPQSLVFSGNPNVHSRSRSPSPWIFRRSRSIRYSTCCPSRPDNHKHRAHICWNCCQPSPRPPSRFVGGWHLRLKVCSYARRANEGGQVREPLSELFDPLAGSRVARATPATSSDAPPPATASRPFCKNRNVPAARPGPDRCRNSIPAHRRRRLRGSGDE